MIYWLRTMLFIYFEERLGGEGDRQSHIGRWCALNSPAKPKIHPPKPSTTITASMREIMSLAAHRVVIGGTDPFFRPLIMSI